MEVQVLVTVGISLLENAQKERRESLIGQLSQPSSDIHQIANELKDLDETTLSTLQKEAQELLDNHPFKSCAELASLEIWRWPGEHHDYLDRGEVEVVLIATRGGSYGDNIESGSIECARMIEERLQHLYPSWRIRTKSVKGGVKTPRLFKMALLDFVRYIGDYVLSEEVRTYVVITGGFKGFIPWVSLSTFLYDNTYLVYLHQEKEQPAEVLLVPGLALSWDLRQLDELRIIVQQERISQEEFQRIPPRYQLLYDEAEEPYTKSYLRNALGELAYTFSKELETRYGYGHFLLTRLKEMDGELWQILRDRFPYWEHLWIGNQVPETVNHERLHSLRLLEYAHWLLEYFPGLRKELGAKGLFYLITSIWLHDIGHGAMHYKDTPVAMVPSKVRELHNLASGDLIRGENADALLAEGGLLPPEHREAVALLAEANRNRIPLTMEQEGEKRGNGELRYDSTALSIDPHLGTENGCKNVSLERKLQSKNEWDVAEKRRLLLVAALLGLVDGLDVQMDRAGSLSYVQSHFARLKYEIKWCLTQVRWAETVMTDPSSVPQLGWESVSDVAEELWKECKDLWERNEFEKYETFVDNKLKPCLEKTVELFNKALEVNNNDTALFQVAAYANQALFKMFSVPHFAKHSSVGLVVPMGSEEKQEMTINLHPLPIQSEQDEAYQNYNVFRDKVSDEIVREILRSLGVKSLSQYIKKDRVKVFGFELKNGSLEPILLFPKEKLEETSHG